LLTPQIVDVILLSRIENCKATAPGGTVCRWQISSTFRTRFTASITTTTLLQWSPRFPPATRIAHAAKEFAEAAAAFDQPAIFAVRAGWIACTAPASSLAGPIGMAWKGRAAGWAGWKQVSTILDMLTPVPVSATLAGDIQQ
jgi:hypothetical protein